MDDAKKLWANVPQELSDRWELIVQEVGKNLYDTRTKTRQAVGTRPYKGLPTDEEELHNRWVSVRHDGEELLTVIRDNMKTSNDGKLLLPNALVAQILKSERRVRSGGYDDPLPVEGL